MPEFKPNVKPNEIDLKARSRVLAACYREILSWPTIEGSKAEPAADDLGGDAEVGSANGASTVKADAD